MSSLKIRCFFQSNLDETKHEKLKKGFAENLLLFPSNCLGKDQKKDLQRKFVAFFDRNLVKIFSRLIAFFHKLVAPGGLIKRAMATNFSCLPSVTPVAALPTI